jgi:hypothetical protein
MPSSLRLAPSVIDSAMQYVCALDAALSVLSARIYLYLDAVSVAISQARDTVSRDNAHFQWLDSKISTPFRAIAVNREVCIRLDVLSALNCTVYSWEATNHLIYSKWCME